MSYFDQKIAIDFVKNYKKYQRKFKSVKNSPCKVIVDYLKNETKITNNFYNH